MHTLISDFVQCAGWKSGLGISRAPSDMKYKEDETPYFGKLFLSISGVCIWGPEMLRVMMVPDPGSPGEAPCAQPYMVAPSTKGALAHRGHSSQMGLLMGL